MGPSVHARYLKIYDRVFLWLSAARTGYPHLFLWGGYLAAGGRGKKDVFLFLRTVSPSFDLKT